MIRYGRTYHDGQTKVISNGQHIGWVRTDIRGRWLATDPDNVPAGQPFPSKLRAARWLQHRSNNPTD